MFPSKVSILSGGASTIFSNSYSLAFDGTNDYIDCGNDSSLRITGNMTVSAWVKSSSSSLQRFITKFGSGTDDSFYLAIQANGKFRFNVSSKEVDSSSAVNDGNWHHLVAQYTASTKLEVFIDGSSDGTNTSSIPSALVDSDQNLRIGAESDDEYPISGNIDEVSIFNAIVSVGDLRNGSIPADLTGISNLQGWWRMGDGDLDDYQLIADQVTPTLGSDILTGTNSDFSVDEGDWQLSTGVTHDSTNNRIIYDNVSEDAGLQHDSAITSGKTYKLTFDIPTHTSGSFHVHEGINNLDISPNNNSSGSKTIYFTATGSSLRIRAEGGTLTCTFDNVLLKEVNGNAGIMKNMTASDIVTDTP